MISPRCTSGRIAACASLAAAPGPRLSVSTDADTTTTLRRALLRSTRRARTCADTPLVVVDLRGRSRKTTPTRKQWVAQHLPLCFCHWRLSQLRHSQPNHPLRSCDSICLASPLTDCRNWTVSAGALRRSARFCRARSRVAWSTASNSVRNAALTEHIWPCSILPA